MTFASVSFGGQVYRVVPGMRLIAEIEDALGGIAPLAGRLSEGAWSAAELVTLTQILLDAAGKTVDWLSLGDAMTAEGLAAYAAAAEKFMKLILDGAKA